MRPPWKGLGKREMARGPSGKFVPMRTVSSIVVCGRKFCMRCGRWRPVSDFPLWGFPGGARLAPRCDACIRTDLRDRYHTESPERRELRREYDRIMREAKRRAAGIPARNMKRVTVIDQVERVLLPREPLVQEMQCWLDADPYRTAGPGFEDTGHNLVLLADLAGVAERTLGRIFSGESAHVRLDVADKVCQAIGTPLALVYDYDEQVAA